MSAVVLWTWVGVVALAVVVLGFCAYEIGWKVKRLGRDVEALQDVRDRLTGLQTAAASAQSTAAVIAANRAHDRHRNGDRLFPHPRDPRPADAGRPA